MDVDGHKMFLDPRDALNLSTDGIWEPFETDLVKKEIRKGDVVLDLGANIGYYTLIFARLVGKEGKVFAFEPDPTNFSLLKKNVEINGYKNVELVQKAVSNRTGRLRLYLNVDDMRLHKIYQAPDSLRSIEIDAVRLDDYFKDYNGVVDFIKMDIEGAEYAAIQGMTDLLKRNRKVKILTEFSPSLLKAFGVQPLEYLELLTDMGFKLYEINDAKKEVIHIDSSELFKIYTPVNESQKYLLCAREVI